VLAHGFAKGALFLAAGIVLIKKSEVDELLLHGRGRDLHAAGAAWLVAAVALASPPFLGTFTGHAMIEDAASVEGYWWVPVVLAFATIGSTGAILRAGARVFLGVGDREDPLLSDQPSESAATRDRPSITLMQTVTLVLAVAGLAVGTLTPLAAHAQEAAHQFVDRLSYTSVVLDHRLPTPPPPGKWTTTTSAVLWGAVTLVGSFGLATLSLYRDRLPRAVTDALGKGLSPLRAAHSGHIGDYVAWLTFGTAVIGGMFAVVIR
jgi:multicomponent Na+:H+ antiporter subunit D